MQCNVNSVSDHPLLLARQRRKQLAVISSVVKALEDPTVPPIGPRPTFAMLATALSCTVATILADAVKMLLGPGSAVSGITGGIVLTATVGAGLYVLLDRNIPRTWRQEREARLSRALCDYSPVDVQAYRDMQQELTDAGALQKDIVMRWLRREEDKVFAKPENKAWRAVLDRKL